MDPGPPTVLTYLFREAPGCCTSTCHDAPYCVRRIAAGVVDATTTAVADIYSFTDENGVTHYTNVPSDARFQVLLHSAPEFSEAGARISRAMLARSAEFDEIIDMAAAQTSVEASLLRAVIVVESAFDPAAVSSRGARGLMQLMPATAKAYGAKNVDDPAQNVRAGARYLRDLIDRYENDLELVLAAYNAGETAVEKHGRAYSAIRGNAGIRSARAARLQQPARTVRRHLSWGDSLPLVYVVAQPRLPIQPD